MKSSQINFRTATEKDVDLIYVWNNDTFVRAQSFSSKSIDYADHLSWFQKKLNSLDDLMLIAELEEVPVSLVRFSEIQKSTSIGIVVDAGFRGKGLATLILKGATHSYFKKHDNSILAFIKKENLASVKTFEKVGFKLLGEDKVNNEVCYKYELRKSTL